MQHSTLSNQLGICNRFSVQLYPAPPEMKVGIAENVRHHIYPINGLRIPPDKGTTGWFIWAGKTYFADPDFFLPLHVAHLDEWCPEALPYLGLPPGWRFLIAPDYEDVWYDEELLKPLAP